MPAEASLHFLVQGSAAAPYKLVAEGIGTTFRMFCSCPAGRMARLMCKHVAGLLMGDVGALVEPSDDVEELARWAHGSDLFARAFHHQPKPRRPSYTLEAPIEAGFEKAFATLVAKAMAAGWTVRAATDGIGLHGRTPKGKIRECPTISIGIAEGFDRPFFVSAPEGASRSFTLPERAGGHFAEIIERFTP